MKEMINVNNVPKRKFGRHINPRNVVFEQHFLGFFEFNLDQKDFKLTNELVFTIK